MLSSFYTPGYPYSRHGGSVHLAVAQQKRYTNSTHEGDDHGRFAVGHGGRKQGVDMTRKQGSNVLFTRWRWRPLIITPHFAESANSYTPKRVGRTENIHATHCDPQRLRVLCFIYPAYPSSLISSLHATPHSTRIMSGTSTPTPAQERDQELLSIGHQCSSKTCGLVDFLPFKCQHCSLPFCAEHYLPNAHSCEKYDETKYNRIAPSCACNSFIRLCVDTEPRRNNNRPVV